MEGQGTHGNLELHLSIDGQECEGRLPSIDRPNLLLHSKPVVVVHPGQATTSAFRTNQLQHLKDSLGVRPLRSIDSMERELIPLEICQRKFLTREPTGVLIQGIHPQLKLIQTITVTTSFMLGTLTKQIQLNLLEHAITLMLGTIVHREDLR